MVVASAGYDVIEASSGEEALRVAHAKRPDLIITDILMPKMDGYEFVRQLRSTPDVADTRVVFYTASYVEDEVRRLAATCGVDHFLPKPSEPEQILDVVARAIGAEPKAVSRPAGAEFARRHMQVVNDRLIAKVDELDGLNRRVEQLNETLRASEQRYRLLFDHNPLPTLVYDRQTLRIVDVNEVLAATYGYSREELLSTTLTTIVPDEDVGTLRAFLAVDPAEPQGEITKGAAGPRWRHQYKDGTLIDVEITSHDFKADGRDFRLAVWQNVTERNRVSAELVRVEHELGVKLAIQNERLLEVDALKDQFVSVVSHELRTPLTAIRGYLEIVLGGEPGPLVEEQTRCLKIAELSCDQLLRVVGDLLLIGRLEAGHLALDVAELDLASTLKACIVTEQPAADAKRIALRLVLTPIPPITGDAGRLTQAVGNIISNAIKFTERGHVEVRLHAAGDRAVIEIIDTGTGVPASEVDHLFVPFFRASTATRQAIPGTGLGLSIAKEIVEAHHGTISVETDEGAGMSVRVELPVEMAQ